MFFKGLTAVVLTNLLNKLMFLLLLNPKETIQDFKTLGE